MKVLRMLGIACAALVFSSLAVQAQNDDSSQQNRQIDQVFKRYFEFDGDLLATEDYFWLGQFSVNNQEGGFYGPPGSQTHYQFHHSYTDYTQFDPDGHPLTLWFCSGSLDADEILVAWVGHSVAATFTANCHRYDPSTAIWTPYTADYAVTAELNASDQPLAGAVFVGPAPWGWGSPSENWWSDPGCRYGFNVHEENTLVIFYADVTVRVDGALSPANFPGLYRRLSSNQLRLLCGAPSDGS